MNTTKKNLDYNTPTKKECFNTRTHTNWTDTARQIDNPCAQTHEIIQELIRVTRENLNEDAL